MYIISLNHHSNLVWTLLVFSVDRWEIQSWENLGNLSRVTQLLRDKSRIFFLILLYFSITILYPIPSSTSAHPTLQSPHCFPCSWVLSLFLFLLYPFNHPIPSRAVSLLSFYESVAILLLSSVCSLHSTYERNHMVVVFLWLAYFT